MLAAICRQQVTVQALTPIDRITPIGNAEHRQPPSPYGWASMTLPDTIRLYWRLSVFRVALPRKEFYDRSATHHLLAATCRILCRFARSSLHRHRLRLNGAARQSYFYCFFNNIQKGLRTVAMVLCIVINDGKSILILRI